MIKKIYRRFLMAAVMLLMATSFTYIAPSARAQSSTQSFAAECYYCYCEGGRCYCVEVPCD